VISKGKQKIIQNINVFILKYKAKAKEHCYNANDDIKCFKRIYVISIVFPVNENYKRNISQVEWQLKELWYLYFYFKHRIEGKNLTYRQIVIKYA
tara:strand:+ start:2593 stop:2877 length:285 start_codon:yes stop_codon:yes gene_type:complete